MASILLVDDSAWIAKTMKKVLEKAGHEVVGMASDGLEGVDLFAQYRPELVLLDITMPNMDGRECLENILEFDNHAKIIMVSAIKEQEVVDDCLAAGAVGYLQKPIEVNNESHLERLFSTIDKALVCASETISDKT